LEPGTDEESFVFKGITNLASLLKQAQQVGGRLQQVNDELKNRRAIGRAGGGMVEVEVNGLGQMLKLTLDPGLVERNDRELLEDLIPAATNQALAKAKELHAEVIKDIASGVELPGLSEMLGKMSAQDEKPNEE
jgi:DNA-binding YbaB/EbfC family protein